VEQQTDEEHARVRDENAQELLDFGQESANTNTQAPQGAVRSEAADDEPGRSSGLAETPFHTQQSDECYPGEVEHPPRRKDGAGGGTLIDQPRRHDQHLEDAFRL
jgi:hypothetical protein